MYEYDDRIQHTANIDGCKNSVDSLQLAECRSSRLDGDASQSRVTLVEQRFLAGEEHGLVVTRSSDEYP